MKKVINVFIGLLMVTTIMFVPLPTEAEETTLSLQELIQTMQNQIEALKAEVLSLQTQLQTQLQTLQGAKGDVKEATKEVKTTLKLSRQLWKSATGDDVALLQGVLATDSDVYPEGLITGYFGPLTERAVKKFQQKMGVEEVGRIGPKTLTKINELLEDGAGSSGEIPPGLLIAPGIAKKIEYIHVFPTSQEFPFGIQKKLDGWVEEEVAEEEEEEEEIEEEIEEEVEEEETPPVISDVTATSTTATTTNITWSTDKDADSVVWYDVITPLTILTSTANVNSSDLTSWHDLLLNDLTASTTYYYLITSTDEEDNKATSTEGSFTTLSE